MNHFLSPDDVLTEFGRPRERLPHIVQSRFHDHVPAKGHGLLPVWMDRRHGRPGCGATPEPKDDYRYDLEFLSIAVFAEAARKAKVPQA